MLQQNQRADFVIRFVTLISLFCVIESHILTPKEGSWQLAMGHWMCRAAQAHSYNANDQTDRAEWPTCRDNEQYAALNDKAPQQGAASISSMPSGQSKLSKVIKALHQKAQARMADLSGQQRAELDAAVKEALECLPANAGAPAQRNAAEGMPGPSTRQRRSTDASASHASKRQRTS